MKKIIITLSLMIFVVFCNGQSVDLAKHVLASGGNLSSNDQTNIGVTIGQTFIGPAKSSDTFTGVGFWYTAADFVTSVDFISESDIHSEIQLLQNYPNPFNDYTIIEFNINDISHVRLNIRDLTGRLVDRVINENMIPGIYKVSYNPEKLTAGVYIYELQVEHKFLSKRMIHTN